MPVFRKPRIDHPWDVDEEVAALRNYSTLPGKEDRAIPPKAADRLLLATWNIANLGAQARRDKDHRLLAEVIGWFDLVAVQEVNGKLDGLRAILAELPGYRTVFNDAGGNNERFAFIYDADKVELQEEIGELTIPAADLPKIKLRDIPARFVGFDRNPMLASFTVRDTLLLLSSVHLYFGKGRGKGVPDDEDAAVTRSSAARSAAERRKEPPPAFGIDRRVLEAFAVAWWANKRHRDSSAYAQQVIALGDFNLPKRAQGDRVYDALTSKGMRLPEHSTRVGGSNVRDDAHYDQMAVWPGALDDAIEQVGIFDFDGAVFRTLWGAGTKAEQQRFFGYVQYYLSDHRPLWMALRV
jgi:endonuclease/exonuclease/phosphatase family metal-dependent hydrolase